MIRHPRARGPATVAALAALLVACGTDENSATRNAPDASANPTTHAASDDYVLLLDDDTDPDQMEGKSGSYAFTARGEGEPPLAVADVPAGYTNFGFFAIWPVDSADESEPFRAIQYWTVHAVSENPCRASEGATEIGGAVDDLAAALGAQKLTTATAPEPVTLDGHDGVYLELTVPTGLDFSRCQLGYFILWEGKPGDAHHTAGSPGLVERLWILDVDGERVVLAVLTADGTKSADTDELVAAVESVRFVDRPE